MTASLIDATQSRNIDREGTFRARPIDQGIKTFKDSMAIAIGVRYQIIEQLDGADWQEVDGYTAFGDLWVIKKDGTPNEEAVKRLMELFGWDGDLETVTSQDWSERPVQINVEANEYDGRTHYSVAWVNPYDYSPQRAVNNIDEETAKQLAARYGAQLRAIGASKRSHNNSAAATSARSRPAGELPPPPPRKSQPRESTKESAWAMCTKANEENVDKATTAWNEAMDAIGKDEDEFTSENWKTLEGKFIPF